MTRAFLVLEFANVKIVGWNEMADLLVVKAKIKEVTKLNVAGDFADALSKKVEDLVKDAERRAKDNGRATVKARDL